MSSVHRSRCVALIWAVTLVAFGCVSGPPPTPVELGEQALAEGDWRAAQTHFGEALALDAGSGRAWHGQARAALLGRDAEGALESLSRLSKVDPERFRGEARETYGDALDGAVRSRIARDQPEAALTAARALARLEPRRNGLPRLLGLSLLAEAERRRLDGDRQGALALYREACEVTPQALEAWVGAAEILLETRKGKQAMRLLEAARKAHPTAGAIRTLTLQALRMR